MKRNFLKRSMALAVAAAVAASSLPTSFAFAEEEIVVEDAALDVVTEEEADAVVEEAAEAEATVTAEPAEEEFVVGIETVEEGAEEAELNAGIQGQPAKVTGLNLVTEGDPTLYWNYMEGVNHYEIMVSDASGIYGWTQDVNGKSIPEYETVGASNNPSIDMPFWAGYLLEQKEDGNWGTKYDADGRSTQAFQPGKTYNVSVRGVNVYKAAETDPESSYYGEWSDPIAYTVPAAAGVITDLAFAYEEDGWYYFTYSAAVNGSLQIQISKTPGFEPDNLVGYSRDYYSDKKLGVRPYDETPGTTYYIRAINASEYPKDEVWATAPAVAFTTKAEAALKTITGLTYKYENGRYNFSFDPVLDEGDEYMIKYTDNAALPFDEWNQIGYLYDNNLDPAKTYYVAAATYKYDYVNRKDVYGTLSNVLTITRNAAVSAIGTLTLVEKNQDGIVFDAGVALNRSESIEYWVSETPEFATPDAGKTTWYRRTSDRRFTVSYSELTPGKTYYVRARVANEYDKNVDELKGEINCAYSAFSNVVSVKTSMPRVNVWTSGVTNTSLLLEMSAGGAEFTGFQIQRKNKKKWATLAKTTDRIYKDTGLQKDTTYTYRVRAYYYDEETGATTYGEWTYEETTTWGAALKLKATPKTKKSIALSWTKVKGAEGYEVYRYATFSDVTQVKDGYYNDFSKYTLIKTLKKSKKSYVDKKLTPGVYYSYIVRAYKTVDGKKCYIEESAGASLAFGGYLRFTKEIKNANGTVKVTWKPVVAADGYVIEQYNSITDEWTVIAKKKATVGTYTFPATTDADGTKYRVRPYKGSEYMEGEEVTVTAYLAAPAGVAAKAAADGSITVTWNPVAGADYYRVYRTTDSMQIYDTNLKAYGIYDGDYDENGDGALCEYVADAAYKSGYKNNGNKIKGTTLVDRPISYTSNGATYKDNEGPTPGVKYFYYVVAFKNGKAYNYTEDRYEYLAIESGISKKASATVTSTTATKKPVLKAKKIKSSKGKVTVQWKKVAGAQGYVIYRSEKKKSGYTIVGSVDKGSTLKYVDGSVTKGKTYYYKVKAVKYNEAGASVLSAFSKVKQIKAK